MVERLFRVCFLGGTRHSDPLDSTAEKKYRVVAQLGNIFVVGFSQGLRPRMFTEHAKFYMLPYLPIAVLRYAEVFTIGTLLLLWVIFRHGVDILVAQSPHEGVPCALAKVIAKLFGRPVVLVIESHGDFAESIFLQRALLVPKVYRIAVKRFARFALSHADLLRAVSSSTRLQLQEWMPNLPVVQFPTWTDIESFKKAGALKRFGDSQRLLYCGVLIPRKGVHHLIQAMAALAGEFPDLKLTIVGRRDNIGYSNELVKSASRLGIADKVFFIDEISQTELANLMAAASVFVLPTYSEGLPRVIFEAMATSLPVIASRVSGIPDIIEDGKTGWLVPPGDEQALAERLRWVLQHTNTALEIGQRAQSMVDEVFSTERYIQGYSQLFSQAQALLATKGRSGRAAAAL